MKFIVREDVNSSFALPGSNDSFGKVADKTNCKRFNQNCPRLAIGCTKTGIGPSAESIGNKM